MHGRSKGILESGDRHRRISVRWPGNHVRLGDAAERDQVQGNLLPAPSCDTNYGTNSWQEKELAKDPSQNNWNSFSRKC
ncbi:MAG: hypothetical protein ACRD22_08965, partial [Terriglobia bacterium]